jgi:hypothetical protein
MTDSSGSYNPAEESHRALRVIQQELERHPIVTTVQGFPSGEFTQLIAHVEPERWETIRENATITVRWFAGGTPDARPEFSLHYSDEQTDFGWHHHEQEHVDGWGHFQERTNDSGYAHESYSFPSQNPAQLTWEIMADLASKLKSE